MSATSPATVIAVHAQSRAKPIAVPMVRNVAKGNIGKRLKMSIRGLFTFSLSVPIGKSDQKPVFPVA